MTQKGFKILGIVASLVSIGAGVAGNCATEQVQKAEIQEAARKAVKEEITLMRRFDNSRRR